MFLYLRRSWKQPVKNCKLRQKKIVTEADGSIVDDEEVLLMCKEVLIVLEEDEEWVQKRQEVRRPLVAFSNNESTY